MRLRLALGLVLLLAVAGCGGGASSPDKVVRAWIAALDAGNNERAGALFAPSARIVQSGTVLRLRSQADAVAWNAALPCSAKIVQLDRRGDTVTATFVLGDRQRGRCDGPGGTATTVIVIRKGKIVLWHQTGSQPASSSTTV